MVALRELAKQIETQQEDDSKAAELKGKNVRGPSLIPDQFYLGKSWKATTEGSDNRYLALRFKGCAHKDKDGQRTPLAENPRLIDLKPGDVYLFERYTEGRNTEFEAFGADDCLCFGDPPVRLTFFEIVGVTQQTKPEKPVRKTASKTGTVGRKGATRKKAASGQTEPDETVDEQRSVEDEATTEEAEESKGTGTTSDKSDSSDAESGSNRSPDKDSSAKSTKESEDDERASDTKEREVPEAAHNR
jgi:hypothetical protein